MGDEGRQQDRCAWWWLWKKKDIAARAQNGGRGVDRRQASQASSAKAAWMERQGGCRAIAGWNVAAVQGPATSSLVVSLSVCPVVIDPWIHTPGREVQDIPRRIADIAEFGPIPVSGHLTTTQLIENECALA